MWVDNSALLQANKEWELNFPKWKDTSMDMWQKCNK